MTYSSLHNHTYYSIQDGFASPDEYMRKAKELGLHAICLTEHGNVYSAPYVYKLSHDYPDIKLLYGVEAYECFDHNIQDPNNKYFHLVVIAKNENGRVAINKLITDSEFYGKYYKPRMDLEMMKPYAKDLIITSACMASKLHRVEDFNKCVNYVKEYKEIFGDNFFLEMQSHRSDDQKAYNKKILELAKQTDTPFIITTDSHAVTKEQLEYQGLFVQIAQDSDTMSESYEGCYMQSVDEIHEIMDEQIGWEHVVLGLETTNYLADLCDDVRVPFQEPKLPPYPIPNGYTERQFIEKLMDDGWRNRGFDKLSADEQKIRREQIKYELDVIEKMGFIGYFLIVWDFINWGRQNGVLFGDGGRGSGAGSIVNYLLGNTGIDPIKYGLIFERFLNPERVGMPDIDTDLHPKEKVIEYLQERYGKMSVCQISNFSYITPTVAIKDTIRILDRDKNRLEKYGKPIGNKTAMEISKLFTSDKWDECIALNGDAINKYSQEIYKDVFRIAKEMSGRVRHVSIHAGGVGIVGTEISDYMPMRLTDKGEQVIQVDKKMVEEIGIVKFDLLGLNTLSIIKDTLEIGNIDHWEIDPNNEEFLHDQKMYDLISSGDTGNIFQIESQGMKDLCKRLKPSSLSEVSDILALYRPDVMQTGLLDEYIERKINNKPFEYVHQDMEKILGRTYGITVYQEQSMEITRVFGGRSMAGADTLRKLLGKKQVDKIKPEIAKLRQEIIDNGYSKDVSDGICDQMEGMGNYSFNQSHSMGYAVISLQTAYLKAHYPVAFYCAVLNSDNGDTGKINKHILEANEHGVEILPPNINKSKLDFSVTKGKILFGLSAITSIGENVVYDIIKEREINGKYKTITDVIERNPQLNSAQIIALIKSGAFTTDKDKKKELIQKYCRLLAEQKNQSEYKEYKDVKSLPSLLILKTQYGIDTKDKEERIRLYNAARKIEHDTVEFEKWKSDKEKKIQKAYDELYEKYADNEEYWEFEAISIFLTNNPFKRIVKHIQRPFSDVEDGQEFFDVGIISKIQKKKDKNKRQYCYINLYCSDGIIEGIVFATAYERYINLINKNEKIAVFGERSSDDTFVLKSMETIDDWIDRCNINLDEEIDYEC